MNSFNHWMVCLDLTNMDDILLGYSKYFSTVLKPEAVTFLHIVEAPEVAEDLQELFPEADGIRELEEVIRDELASKIEKYYGDPNTDIDTQILIKSGNATNRIIELMEGVKPDLLFLGKKSGYPGEGVIARRVVKYVPCSILFVPENSRYRLENLLVPIDFSRQSAKAIRCAEMIAEAGEGRFKAQHVYKYPARFFPYIPSDEFEETMQEHLDEELNKFKKKNEVDSSFECVFSVNDGNKAGDKIYDQAVREQTDLIIVGAKGRSNVAALLTDELADKLADYQFGIPLLIYKDKKEHMSLLKTLLDK
ncbi:MAG: universal stress protein [Balneolaceae bacterium]